ncbi:MAG: alcohol dehydrogenase catalytic domain-containing protein [Verrucomicrobiota bacterium]
MTIPNKQHALQLTGPEELILNREKEVPRPGPRQLLCRVIVVGACFSDLKLLKQFSSHARKSPVIAGIDPAVLAENPCYVPGEKPTVPGHEPVVEIVETGEEVTHFKTGERYFIQADWRWLKTEHSNGAFGYNFEGAMQEYTLLDDRIIFSPEGECMLLPVEQGQRSASAFGLIEPWACVEESYRAAERKQLCDGGQLLIVADKQPEEQALAELFKSSPRPASIRCIGLQNTSVLPVQPEPADSLAELPSENFNDIIYFGDSADTVETLFEKCAADGLININLCNGKLARQIDTPLGAIHYQNIRITGSKGGNPVAGLNNIPETGEIRPGDIIDVVGAGGPMGTMHVIRNIRRGISDITVLAGDLSDERLETLDKIAAPSARESGVSYSSYNPKTSDPESFRDYFIIMAPVPELVANSVNQAKPHAIINIFAGIPTDKSGKIDLNYYLENGLYFIGTSGSVMEDMRIVLERVQKGQLDTNVSVAAVCGLDGAVDALEAIKNQEVAGKIMIYPECKGLGLIKLSDMPEEMPDIATKLNNEIWTLEAEQALLQKFGA